MLRSHLMTHSSIKSHICEYCAKGFRTATLLAKHVMIHTGIFTLNKKVLLRERKRHTAHRVVSTPSVVLPGYPPGGVPGQVPPRGYPDPPPRGGTRPGSPPGGGARSGTPPGGYPDPPGGYPVRYPPGGTWTPGGYPARYPPGGGTRTPPPPPRCGQTNKVKLLPSRRTTYAGGKNVNSFNELLNVDMEPSFPLRVLSFTFYL